MNLRQCPDSPCFHKAELTNLREHRRFPIREQSKVGKAQQQNQHQPCQQSCQASSHSARLQPASVLSIRDNRPRSWTERSAPRLVFAAFRQATARWQRAQITAPEREWMARLRKKLARVRIRNLSKTRRNLAKTFWCCGNKPFVDVCSSYETNPQIGDAA